ncbi:MAG: four helix bundle protein [Phaeodactylibacter sp.]|nr:four helix bundle protein [Phaeodactylibacter sp.]
MEKVTRFEDLHCWQSARVLVRKVFEYSKSGALSSDWDTRSQFRRAAVSAMNNIAEGFGRFSDKDQIRFYEISSSSASEVKRMLYLFEDIGYLPPQILEELHLIADKTRNQTLGLIRYLNSK